MTYNVTISQVGQQGIQGPAGVLETDTLTGDLLVTGDLTVQGVNGNVVQAFKDVAALLADTTLSYSGLSAGDVITTRSEAFAYEVAASDATDEHVTTAGGVKLYVLAGSARYDVKAFGAVGDGATDDTAAIQAAVTAQQGKSLYFPSGIYVNTANPTGADDVLMTGEPFTTFSGTKLPLHNPIFTGNKQVALVAAVLRYYTTADGVPSDGWYLLQAKSGANHDPVLLGPITASGAGSLALDVDFDEFGIDPTIWTPSGFVCGPDETLALDGWSFGASVSTTSVTINGASASPRTAYIYYDGSDWQSSNASYTFNWLGGSIGQLEVTRDSSEMRSTITSGSTLPFLQTRIQAGDTPRSVHIERWSAESFRLTFRNISDGSAVTAEDTSMKVAIMDPVLTGQTFNFSENPGAGSNIWMIGVFTRKEADYP